MLIFSRPGNSFLVYFQIWLEFLEIIWPDSLHLAQIRHRGIRPAGNDPFCQDRTDSFDRLELFPGFCIFNPMSLLFRNCGKHHNALFPARYFLMLFIRAIERWHDISFKYSFSRKREKVGMRVIKCQLLSAPINNIIYPYPPCQFIPVFRHIRTRV